MTNLPHADRLRILRRKARSAALVFRLLLSGAAALCGASLILVGGDCTVFGLASLSMGIIGAAWALFSDVPE